MTHPLAPLPPNRLRAYERHVSPLLLGLVRALPGAGRRDRCHECGRRILGRRDTGFVLLDDWRIEPVTVHRRCSPDRGRTRRPGPWAGLLVALAAGLVLWALTLTGLAVLLAETGAWTP